MSRTTPTNNGLEDSAAKNSAAALAAAALAVSALALLALAPACGGSNPDPSERYMALAPGMSWTFVVTDVSSGATETKTQTVGPLEDVGGAKAGIMAFRLTTVKVSGMVESWQEDTGEAILRHREQDFAGANRVDEIYDPYKLRVDDSDAHSTLGASWTEDYTEVVTDVVNGGTTMQPKTETWSIEAIDEVLTVPAGTFNTMRVHRISMANTGGSDKMYWFARGVGKVKEASVDRIEELSSYTIP